jgi:hypothetical protein
MPREKSASWGLWELINAGDRLPQLDAFGVWLWLGLCLVFFQKIGAKQKASKCQKHCTRCSIWKIHLISWGWGFL